MYTPNAPPGGDDHREILGWVFQELIELSGILANLESGVFLVEHTAAPAKPRERQIAFADGTSWNPGNGKGVYVFYNNAWHFLG